MFMLNNKNVFFIEICQSDSYNHLKEMQSDTNENGR